MIDLSKEKKAVFLKKCEEWEDRNTESVDVPETHEEADQALLELIGDQDITDAFNKLQKWYA